MVRKGENRQTVVCSTVKHAEAVTEAFNQQNIIAETITGELTSLERANILKRYT